MRRLTLPRLTALAVMTLVLPLVIIGCSASKTQTDTTQTDMSQIKRIALSYDDAPRGDGLMFTGAERTQAMIAQWNRAQTGPVAIFVTTRGLDTQSGRDRIAAYAAAGHLIANHSHAHMWSSRTDTDAYIADIDQAEAALAPFDNRRPWFRFPYLDEGGYGDAPTAEIKRDALRGALAARDLMSGYVTIDTYDWHLDQMWQDALRDGKSVDRAALSQLYTDMVVEAAAHYDRMAVEILGRRPAQVVLLHENDLAASFTVDMVAALRADGWTIIDPDAAFADPIAQTLPETRFAGMGRIAALAQDAGRSGEDYFDHWSASEAGIEARLSANNVFRD